MRDILPDIQKWDAQTPVCVATVAQTWGSAPRQMGAKLAFTPDYKLSGSVSGGCIEPAVIEAGLEVLRTGAPRLLHFGVADETAFEQIGLACGGSIEVFVEPLTPAARAFWDEAAKGDLAAVSVTMLDDPAIGAKVMMKDGAEAQVFAGADPEVIEKLKVLAREQLSQPNARTRRHALPGAGHALVEVFLPQPTLILVGGAHIAVALTPMAKQLGYRVIILDPREAFASRERFPSADERIIDRPDKALARMSITRNTAIVALTHNETLDDPVLKMALRSKAFYVGALGGKTTREKRLARLRAAGFAEAELARLRQPIGLDIGAASPEEIALATMVQIVAESHKN